METGLALIDYRCRLELLLVVAVRSLGHATFAVRSALLTSHRIRGGGLIFHYTYLDGFALGKGATAATLSWLSKAFLRSASCSHERLAVDGTNNIHVYMQDAFRAHRIQTPIALATSSHHFRPLPAPLSVPG